MLFRVTDLTGASAPYISEECDLPEDVRAILDELSCEVDGPWFIGEYQFDEI